MNNQNQMKPGDLVEAWQEIEDPKDEPPRRALGVLIEAEDYDGEMAYNVAFGPSFSEWFCHAKKRDWTIEDLKREVGQ